MKFSSASPRRFDVLLQYTHVGDNEKSIGKAPESNRIQDGGFTNMLI